MHQKNLKILLVDDSLPNLKVLGATFEDQDFIVLTASSVEHAQEILRTHATEIDLVLSDIQMPGLTGFDLVSWMKADQGPLKSIPILLITSQLPESEHRIKGLSLGAVDYLLRSLDPEEIVLRVIHAIENFAKIKNLKQTLESTECLVSTGRLFAASNHEIKNVAQFVLMGVNILERELNCDQNGLSDTSRQALKMLSQSSNLLCDVTKMIGGLVSNADAPIGPLDLIALTEHVAAMTRPLLKKEIVLSFDGKTSVWGVGSAIFLKQILINLLLNARDAIDEAKRDIAGKITISIDVYGSDIELSVMDNGVGFPRDETRNDFQPFASTKQLRGGTGLGLWLSSHLTQKMGGSLTLSSDGLGKGAKAKIKLMKAKI